MLCGLQLVFRHFQALPNNRFIIDGVHEGVMTSHRKNMKSKLKGQDQLWWSCPELNKREFWIEAKKKKKLEDNWIIINEDFTAYVRQMELQWPITYDLECCSCNININMDSLSMDSDSFCFNRRKLRSFRVYSLSNCSQKDCKWKLALS